MQTFQGRTLTGEASDKQVSFLTSLIEGRQVPTEHEAAVEMLRLRAEGGTLSKQEASDAINWFKGLPYKISATPAGAPVFPVTEPGVYETPEGKIYQVKWNRGKTNLYAKVLTMTSGEAARLTATGATVKAEYVYEAGAIRKISATDRITGERAEELSIVFSNCIVCGRHLKAADSVKAGIGPVCRGKV